MMDRLGFRSRFKETDTEMQEIKQPPVQDTTITAPDTAAEIQMYNRMRKNTKSYAKKGFFGRLFASSQEKNDFNKYCELALKDKDNATKKLTLDALEYYRANYGKQPVGKNAQSQRRMHDAYVKSLFNQKIGEQDSPAQLVNIDWGA